MDWRLGLSALLFSGVVWAADWSGASWERLYLRPQGEYLGLASRALPCQGDTVYFHMYADSGNGHEQFEFYHFHPSWGLEELPLHGPWIGHMLYDSVDHHFPAFHTGRMVYRFREDHWDSLALDLSNSGGDNEVSGVTIDSTGAVHYMLYDGASDMHHYGYRRRGVGQSELDLMLNCDSSGLYEFIPGSGQVVSPTVAAAFAIVGLYDYYEVWTDPDYPNIMYPFARCYQVFRIENGEFHPAASFPSCGGNGVHAFVLPGGDWLLGRRNPLQFTGYLFHATGGFDYVEPFVEEVYTWRAAYNMVAGSLELAVMPRREQPPFSVQLAAFDSTVNAWGVETEIATPATLKTFDFFIDEAGRGHLFCWTENEFWHYGAPYNGTESRSIPVAITPRLSITPNPFNAVTSISFHLPRASRVELRVYDVTGRLTATLTDALIPAGAHRVEFDGRAFASGMYFVSLRADQFAATRKLLLLK